MRKSCGTASWSQREQIVQVALDRHPDESRRPSSGLSQGADLPGRAAHLRLRGADRPRIGQRRQQQPPVDPPAAGRGRHPDGHGGSRLLMEEYEMQKRHLRRRRSAVRHRTIPKKDTPIACSKPAMRSSSSGSPIRSKRARWGCLFLGALHRLGFAPVHRHPAGNAGRPLTQSCTAATVLAPRSGLCATCANNSSVRLRKAAARSRSTRNASRITWAGVAGNFRHSRYAPCNRPRSCPTTCRSSSAAASACR